MEILTPSSKTLKDTSEKKAKFVCFRPCRNRIGISKQTVKEFALKDRMKLTFVIDMGSLYFYISKKEGFLLKIDKYGGGVINSTLLTKTIEEKIPSVKINGPHFGIRVCNSRINECATFEILVHNDLKQKKSSLTVVKRKHK